MKLHKYMNENFGKIVEVFLNDKFLVRCSGGVLLVNKYKCKKKIIKKTINFDNSKPNLRRFKRNNYGFFDI